jgi:hypothetical protein
MKIRLPPTATPTNFASVARDVFKKRGDRGYNKNKTFEALDKEICQFFLGTSYEICAELWNLIDPVLAMSKDAEPKHLLWTICFLKNYCTKKINTRIVGGVDEKTFRKWVWIFVPVIAKLTPEVVSYFTLLSFM